MSVKGGGEFRNLWGTCSLTAANTGVLARAEIMSAMVGGGQGELAHSARHEAASSTHLYGAYLSLPSERPAPAIFNFSQPSSASGRCVAGGGVIRADRARQIEWRDCLAF